MPRLAVTGGVAEGKSTVVSYLRDLGYKTASSDEMARGVFMLKDVQIGLSHLIQSTDPVTPDQLREQLVASPELRREVNRLMHPRILQRLRSIDADVLEVPLLIETCLQSLFERVWVVTCGPVEQERRLIARLGDRDSAAATRATQLPTEVKAAFADVVVRTNRAPEDVKRFVAGMARRSLG